MGNAFDAKLKEIEEKLIGDIEKKIKDKTSEIEKMIINKFGLAQAVSFHMLGNKCREEKEFKEALNDFCTAGIGYLKGEDILNIQRVNANIKLTLSEIKKEDLESLLEEESQPTNYISLLEDSDKNGIFTDLIKDFKRLVAKKIKSEDKA